MTSASLPLGIRDNYGQFIHQLIQVLLVGFAIGMTRTVIPAFLLLRKQNSAWCEALSSC